MGYAERIQSGVVGVDGDTCAMIESHLPVVTELGDLADGSAGELGRSLRRESRPRRVGVAPNKTAEWRLPVKESRFDSGTTHPKRKPFISLNRITGISTDRYAGVLRRDPCPYCGGTSDEVDHILPISLGGANGWENRTGSCAACNRQKGSLPLLLFLLLRQRRRLSSRSGWTADGCYRTPRERFYQLSSRAKWERA
jgi:hypothetical protein